MSAAPPVKRQKTDGVNYLSVIELLPYRTLGDILAEAGQKYPEIAARIMTEHNKRNGVVQVKTTHHFHSQVHSASYILNGKYSHLRCSQQFEKAFRAAAEVRAVIKEILKATPADSSSGTKKNALEALLQIGTSICHGGEELGREVRKEFQYGDCLEKSMLRIAKSMTVEERSACMTQGFERKLSAFESEAAGYCLFEELADVRKALLNAQELQDEEDEGADTEDDEDCDEEENTEDDDDEEDV